VTPPTEILHREIDVGSGLTIHVAECGGGPAVILLHGFTGSIETWSSFLPAFAARNQVIALDQPGHGRSSSPSDPRRYRLGRLSGDIATVLDAMEVDRAVLLGYSMGGRAALRFAVDHPDRIAGLVLESASPGIADEKQKLERRASDSSLADKIETDGVEAFVDGWETLSLWDSQRSVPQVARDGLRRQRLLNNRLGLANSLRGAGAAEDEYMVGAASAIKAPTLFIAGALDSKYVALAKTLQRSIAGSRLEIIPNSGHATHLEQPQAFASAVTAFLGSIPFVGNRWTPIEPSPRHS
jgi:2-succinyl-6-hydroxy-2,4-cyclohexadiene-1-carboxylate synthase